MRKPIIAGNWKMNKSREEALHFVNSVNSLLPSKDIVESVVCSQSLILFIGIADGDFSSLSIFLCAYYGEVGAVRSSG